VHGFTVATYIHKYLFPPAGAQIPPALRRPRQSFSGSSSRLPPRCSEHGIDSPNRPSFALQFEFIRIELMHADAQLNPQFRRVQIIPIQNNQVHNFAPFSPRSYRRRRKIARSAPPLISLRSSKLPIPCPSIPMRPALRTALSVPRPTGRPTETSSPSKHHRHSGIKASPSVKLRKFGADSTHPRQRIEPSPVAILHRNSPRAAPQCAARC